MKYTVTYETTQYPEMPIMAKTFIGPEMIVAHGKDADQATKNLIEKIRTLTETFAPEPREIEV